MATPSAADVTVAAPTGDVDSALLVELSASLEQVVGAEASPAGKTAELRASANASAAGVTLEVVLVPADGSAEIRETREASRASALAQARAMARSAVRAFAERARSKAGPAKPLKEIATPPPPPSPIDLARTAARPGIALGLGLDIAGFLGITVSLIVGLADDDHGDGMLVGICASGGAVALGSLVSTTSYTMRYAAYRRAGLMPRPYKASLSWVLTTATAALYGVSVYGLAEYMSLEDKPAETLNEALAPVEYAFEMMVFVEGAILAEALNLGVVRTLWRRELRRSERISRVSVAVAPFVAPSGSRSTRPVAGLAATVLF
jgi:hypothetical protein